MASFLLVLPLNPKEEKVIPFDDLLFASKTLVVVTFVTFLCFKNIRSSLS